MPMVPSADNEIVRITGAGRSRKLLWSANQPRKVTRRDSPNCLADLSTSQQKGIASVVYSGIPSLATIPFKCNSLPEIEWPSQGILSGQLQAVMNNQPP